MLKSKSHRKQKCSSGGHCEMKVKKKSNIQTKLSYMIFTFQQRKNCQCSSFFTKKTFEQTPFFLWQCSLKCLCFCYTNDCLCVATAVTVIPTI